MLTMLCFDADDTLWHNERFFRMTQDHFEALLADYAEQEHLAERLLEAEKRNIGHYGFGIIRSPASTPTKWRAWRKTRLTPGCGSFRQS